MTAMMCCSASIATMRCLAEAATTLSSAEAERTRQQEVVAATTCDLEAMIGDGRFRDITEGSGAGDTGYSPWGKPAEDVLRRWQGS